MLMIGTAQIRVNNVAEHAGDFKYWVVRIVDGEAWYYSAHNKRENAQIAAEHCGGIVVENKEV